MKVSRELRLHVAGRAGGRCEYCLLHEGDAAFPHEVDHVVSRKHGGASTLNNLAYACVYCNRYKGSDIARLDDFGKAVRLFNPRLDQWTDHFHLDGALIQPLTPEAERTAKLLRFNNTEAVVERRLLQQLGRYPQG